jgi:hypothetical protein
MNPMPRLRDLPLFPVIPLVPIALFVGSVVVSFNALKRVRRLERRLKELAS